MSTTHPYRPLAVTGAPAAACLFGAVQNIGHLPANVSGIEVFWIACEIIGGAITATFAVCYAWQAARWEACRRLRRARPDTVREVSHGRHAGAAAPLGPAAVAQGYVPMSRRPAPPPAKVLPLPEVPPRAQPRIVVWQTPGRAPDDTLLGWSGMPAPTREMPVVETTAVQPAIGPWTPPASDTAASAGLEDLYAHHGSPA